MQIHGTQQVHQAQTLNGPHAARSRPAQKPLPQPVDEVQISSAAQLAAETSSTDGIRHDVVARLKAEIASGTYETPEKVAVAVDRLFDSLG